MDYAPILAVVGLSLLGCKSGMIQYSGGAVYAASRKDAGASVETALGAGTDSGGGGLGASAAFVVAKDTALLVEQGQLQVVGARSGAFRGFGRVGAGFDVGWMDEDFGGGGVASGTLGLALGRGDDAFTIHANVTGADRFGETPGEAFFGLFLGRATLWRDDE